MANGKAGRPRKMSTEEPNLTWVRVYLDKCEYRIECAKRAYEEAVRHNDTEVAEEIKNAILQVIDLCNTYRRALNMEESNYNFK